MGIDEEVMKTFLYRTFFILAEHLAAPNRHAMADFSIIIIYRAMNDQLYTWETWHRSGEQSWPRSWRTPVSAIDHVLDSQRRFQSMLADSSSEPFYSRTDLRMFIDSCRTEARVKILAVYSETCYVDVEGGEGSQELVLHAAAKLKVSPLNTMQLIKDYPDLVRRIGGPDWSMPLHVAAAAVGSGHLDRMKPFLMAYPNAVKHANAHRLVPMQSALIHGADFDVMKALVEAFPPALEYPFLPQAPVTEDLAPLVGLLPFHIACCRNRSLDVIFLLVLECPDCISVGSSFERSLEKITL